jgi:hypothetical protein
MLAARTSNYISALSWQNATKGGWRGQQAWVIPAVGLFGHAQHPLSVVFKRKLFAW